MSLKIMAQEVLSFVDSSLAQIVIGVALLFACSQIEIALEPVPITLQTLGVTLIGLTYSRRNAVASTLSYLCLGFLGMPVFAGYSSGIAKLFGPTGGYLLGFLICVLAMTWFRDKFPKSNLHLLIANSAIGTSVIFLFGLLWLAHFVGIKGAMQVGLLPFILPGTIKVVLLSLSLQVIGYEGKSA